MVRDIVGVMARLREGGMSLLLVEQNVALAAEVSDRAYVMSLGRVVHEIRPGEWDGFRSNEALLRAYLGGERAGRESQLTVDDEARRRMRKDVSGWTTRLRQEDIARYTAGRRMAQRHAGRLRAAPGAARARSGSRWSKARG